MDKKSVSASLLVMFLALNFAVIGVCFTTFVYKKNIIKFENIMVNAVSGIDVFEDEKLIKKIDKLKLSDMELGLKPATGELDAESQIPSTITDEGTSEGYYETIFVKASGSYRIVLKDIKIGFIILSIVFSILCLIGIVCSFLIKNGIYVLIIFLHYELLLLFIAVLHITK
mgnify:CR=1 FL=1